MFHMIDLFFFEKISRYHDLNINEVYNIQTKDKTYKWLEIYLIQILKKSPIINNKSSKICYSLKGKNPSKYISTAVYYRYNTSFF